MFKRVIFEDWHYLVPIISFALTFLAFVVFVVRAIIMKPDRAALLSQLPLQEDQIESHNVDGE